MFFQVAIIAFAVLMLLRTWTQQRAQKVAKQWLALWAIIWIVIIAVALAPQTADVIAGIVGVGRGADLFVYIAILFLLYASIGRLCGQRSCKNNRRSWYGGLRLIARSYRVHLHRSCDAKSCNHLSLLQEPPASFGSGVVVGKVGVPKESMTITIVPAGESGRYCRRGASRCVTTIGQRPPGNYIVGRRKERRVCKNNNAPMRDAIANGAEYIFYKMATFVLHLTRSQKPLLLRRRTKRLGASSRSSCIGTTRENQHVRRHDARRGVRLCTR